MARNNNTLLELDVDKLFEDHKIEEIVEIEKLLDAEIERKRVDLRSMVGDRYKDVLAASDAIKSMKTISQQIVDNVQSVSDICESLIVNRADSELEIGATDSHSNEKRELIIQIRLALFINEQIWIALDKGDNLTAAQFYLLAQHINMGLNLTTKEYLDRLPLLKQIRGNLQTLKDQFFYKIKETLESVEITAEETSSNLNALLLLKNQSTNDLLNIFIQHRKATLNTVMNTAHSSVRLQISAMVKCIITTIHLLHDCFICYGDSKKGLIWLQLQSIVQDSSIPTLEKIDLPITPLISYIPNIIKQFRPKYKSNIEEITERVKLEDWLESTKQSVEKGLTSSLKLITNVKGLHIIREEALKIELPLNWNEICSESGLPPNFNVWYYFFQVLITSRARDLISKKISAISENLETDISDILSSLKADDNETDLRSYSWIEDPEDISRTENKHTGLSMKILGYSTNIVKLCEKLDAKYLELLVDLSQYLYSTEYTEDLLILTHLRYKRKVLDREELESHLRSESIRKASTLTACLQDALKSERNQTLLVAKSLLCARFLQAVTVLCPHFNKCCTFTATTEWTKMCAHFTQSSLKFWDNWVNRSAKETERMAQKLFGDVSVYSMISILLKWDTFEIQEQTDEKVFKSQIKVPLKPSLLLHDLLTKLNDDLVKVLPHTLPKQIHADFVDRNVECVLGRYKALASRDLNQNQSLQFLFDVKFLTTFCIGRESGRLVNESQEICDILRGKIDPFDLDVFYSYLQNNVKRAVLQSQAILGCLLPSSTQLANLGMGEKFKDQEKDPSILSLSTPSIAFPLFCTFVHSASGQRAVAVPSQEVAKVSPTAQSRTTPKKSQDATAALRSAAALFGGLTTDWFS